MLSTAERLVLLALQNHGYLTVAGLAGYVDLDRPTRLRAVENLLAHGYLENRGGSLVGLSDLGTVALRDHYTNLSEPRG